ncbi:MAG: hypothetical protein Q7K65_00415 [Candidatus Buchananbacteria bacterium]|nr:hypothetical protein [Candidatus Buchananbacteria bacterium]
MITKKRKIELLDFVIAETELVLMILKKKIFLMKRIKNPDKLRQGLDDADIEWLSLSVPWKLQRYQFTPEEDSFIRNSLPKTK